MENADVAAGAAEWASLEDAPSDVRLKGLIPSKRTWYWELGKPAFKRRLVESGALIKVGKFWRVNLVKAPEVIEAIYRENSLAALDRAAAKPRAKRADRARITA